MSSGFVKAGDGNQIFYKDWGSRDAQPIAFHHDRPLSADKWDTQMLFFLLNGYRIVAHDRRGHGRSTQVDTGNDMDRYATDASAAYEHLALRNAVHIGHSAGGDQVARDVARYGEPQGRVAKAVLISSVPPLMLQTPGNPDGTPISVFDGYREALAANRAQFYRDVASWPFYGFNRPGANVSQAGHLQLVAAGNGRRRTGPLRAHRGPSRNRPDPRSQGHDDPHAGDAGR